MRITGRGIWGEPRDPDEARRVLRRALEFIDTAHSYGPEVSERLIGEALHPYPDELVVATKSGLQRSGPDAWPPDGRPETIRRDCERSLTLLRRERIDLLQLHRVDPRVPIEESLGAIAALRDEGKVDMIGVSNVSVDELERARAITDIVSVQRRTSPQPASSSRTWSSSGSRGDSTDLDPRRRQSGPAPLRAWAGDEVVGFLAYEDRDNTRPRAAPAAGAADPSCDRG